jgi:transcriptional regulator with XRE-family HTH domain
MQDEPRGTEFKDRLRKAIADAGLTQEAVAREINVSLRAVQFWVAGTQEPKGRQLVALSRVLNRDPAWFFGTEPEKKAAA